MCIFVQERLSDQILPTTKWAIRLGQHYIIVEAIVLSVPCVWEGFRASLLPVSAAI